MPRAEFSGTIHHPFIGEYIIRRKLRSTHTLHDASKPKLNRSIIGQYIYIYIYTDCMHCIHTFITCLYI
uniref:Uncharacterized protein n=1 Tax=Rhizophora mucronata TaxID=61149 RepID=A0A2P2JPI2_RHIMU